MRLSAVCSAMRNGRPLGAATKKVLGVVGSPRRHGNTHVLVSKILEGAQARGATGDLLFLEEMAIHECDGCHVCWSGRPCSKQDDMNAAYSMVADADAIVFGTPVYWYCPTALMKGFVDRFVYFNCPENRPKVAGKPAALAVPFEEEDPECASLTVAFFERCLRYLEMDLIGTVLVPGVTRKGEVAYRTDALQEAHHLGEALIGRLQET